MDGQDREMLECTGNKVAVEARDESDRCRTRRDRGEPSSRSIVALQGLLEGTCRHGLHLRFHDESSDGHFARIDEFKFWLRERSKFRWNENVGGGDGSLNGGSPDWSKKKRAGRRAVWMEKQRRSVGGVTFGRLGLLRFAVGQLLFVFVLGRFLEFLDGLAKTARERRKLGAAEKEQCERKDNEELHAPDAECREKCRKVSHDLERTPALRPVKR